MNINDFFKIHILLVMYHCLWKLHCGKAVLPPRQFISILFGLEWCLNLISGEFFDWWCSVWNAYSTWQSSILSYKYILSIWSTFFLSTFSYGFRIKYQSLETFLAQLIPSPLPGKTVRHARASFASSWTCICWQLVCWHSLDWGQSIVWHVEWTYRIWVYAAARPNTTFCR